MIIESGSGESTKTSRGGQRLPSGVVLTERASGFSVRYQGLGEASGAEGAHPFHGPFSWGGSGRDPRLVSTKGASPRRSPGNHLLLLTPGLLLLLDFKGLPALVFWLHSWALVGLCVPRHSDLGVPRGSLTSPLWLQLGTPGTCVLPLLFLFDLRVPGRERWVPEVIYVGKVCEGATDKGPGGGVRAGRGTGGGTSGKVWPAQPNLLCWDRTMGCLGA